jgi:hypothetical protein
MSVLQELIAAAVGIPVGDYRQISNNFHAYLEVEGVKELIEFPESPNLYRTKGVTPYPLVNITPWSQWLLQCEEFCNDPISFHYGFNKVDSFFMNVAQPMYKVWAMRKEGKGTGLELVHTIQDEAWAIACADWIMRREIAKS